MKKSQRKILIAIVCIIALLGTGYLTIDYWYPIMMNNCRECGLKYFPEYAPTSSSNVTLISARYDMAIIYFFKNL